MENTNVPQNFQQAQMLHPAKKWYQHKGIISIMILTVISAILILVYLILNQPLDLGPIVVQYKARQLQQSATSTSITWENYSNEFIEFQYSSDFTITDEKFYTQHQINPKVNKDIYGVGGLMLESNINNISNPSVTIDEVPNYNNLGDEQIAINQQIFDKAKSQPGDYFSTITVDGQKASYAHIEAFSHPEATGMIISRIGSNTVQFCTKVYCYEIQLIWEKPTDNDAASKAQTEFKKFLTTFHVLSS